VDKGKKRTRSQKGFRANSTAKSVHDEKEVHNKRRCAVKKACDKRRYTTKKRQQQLLIREGGLLPNMRIAVFSSGPACVAEAARRTCRQHGFSEITVCGTIGSKPTHEENTGGIIEAPS